MVMHVRRMKSALTRIYYLDTNICIFYMRNPKGILADRINAINPERIKIHAIVKAELLVGAEKSKRREDTLIETLVFLMPYEIVPFDDSMTQTYAQIRATLERKGQKIGWNNTIIAATALAKNAILVTNNAQEFGRIDGLKCEDWTLQP